MRLSETDASFLHVIKNIAIGQLDNLTMNYMKKLNRALETSEKEETTRLFSVNVLTDMYNRDCLVKLKGDMFEYEAIDEGDVKYLEYLTVQKTLWLKKKAKVMLLRNQSDQLVNGLRGVVRELSKGEVEVYFPTLEKLTVLKRMNFAVYDPASNRNGVVRNQIPLKLAYALTVHKSQGMTLDRVEVDCRQMFQPGQLAVAMSRVRSCSGLRVVNFSKDAVIPQPEVILEFLNKSGKPVENNTSCCNIR